MSARRAGCQADRNWRPIGSGLARLPSHDVEASSNAVERVAPDVEVVSQRRTIVTALPLRREARQRLGELLSARVVDVRESIDHPDLVLTPACSPQLIALLSQKYHGAQIVVVELDDWEFDIELSGPVKRMLRGGAAAYVVADSIEELASKIAARPDDQTTDDEPAVARELPAGATVDDLVLAFLRSTQTHPR